MQKLLTKKERQLLNSYYTSDENRYCHPLLLVCWSAFSLRAGRLENSKAEAEDIFRSVAELLDLFNAKWDADSITQKEVDEFWTCVLNDVRYWSESTVSDRVLIADTIFRILRQLMCHHWKELFCECLFDYLTKTLERENRNANKEELNRIDECLNEHSFTIDDWINNEYDGHLSEEIELAIKGQKKEVCFIPNGQTFTKSSWITDTQLDIIGQRLAQANKLEANPDDFRKLFSGVNSKFTMKWLGFPGELRDLFKMFTNSRNGKSGYITPKRGYQIILRSHFVDKDGNQFGNLDGQKSIESFKPIIDDCEFLIQHLTDRFTEAMKRIFNENSNALEESGYFNNTTSAMQAGLSISNKLR